MYVTYEMFLMVCLYYHHYLFSLFAFDPTKKSFRYNLSRFDTKNNTSSYVCITLKKKKKTL